MKVKLYMENSSLLALDDRELARLVLRPTCTGVMHAPEVHSQSSLSDTCSLAGRPFRHTDCYAMHTTKHCPDQLHIKISLRMEKPSNLKYCGYVFHMN